MSFNGLDLDGQILEWTDVRGYRFASHEFLKRDGALQEPMGRKPHKVKFNLVYVGLNWRKDFAQLLGLLDQSPFGTLIHPFFGQMKVACEGIEGARVNSEHEINTVLVPISFIENNVDQSLQFLGSKSVFSGTASVSTYSSNLTTATNIYIIASFAVALFRTVVLQYSAAVARQLASGTIIPDPTIPSLFGSLVLNASLARTAVRADPLYVNDAAGYAAIEAIELLLASCHELDDLLKTNKPTLQMYTVPAQTSLLTISQNFYGRDALSRLDEIRANNLGKIPNPAAIKAGTVLLLAPPTLNRLKLQ